MTQLTISFTGTPAPRCGEKNLWIDIDIDRENATALFHCTNNEHVGSGHKDRTVTYRADQDCQLKFVKQNGQVFLESPPIELKAHHESALHVNNTTSNASADYEVYADTKIPAATVKAALSSQIGPHIVVP